MPWTSIRALILLCLVLGIYLWFRRVWNIMKARQMAVDVAQKQWQAAEERGDTLSAEAFSAVLARSESIYSQAVAAYNQALAHPLHWLPATIMGFHPLVDTGSVEES